MHLKENKALMASVKFLEEDIKEVDRLQEKQVGFKMDIRFLNNVCDKCIHRLVLKAN